MTRITFITSIILSVVFISNNPLNAATKGKMDIVSTHADAISTAETTSENQQPTPSTAHPQPLSHPKRMHGPSMEELPHIHHFHKERVKKIKKHHNKFWIVAKFILVLCHVGLLILGYIHATH